MKTYQTQFTIFRLALDIAILALGFYVTSILELREAEQAAGDQYFYLVMLAGLIWYASGKMTGLYDEFRSRNFSYELTVLLKSFSIFIIGFVFVLVFIRETMLTRSFVVYFGFISLFGLGLQKLILRLYLERIRRKGKNIRKVLIIGAGYIGRRFRQTIVSNPHFGYRFIGFIDDKPRPGLNGELLGDLDMLETVLSQRQIDDVLISLPSHAHHSIEQVIRVCENHPVHVRILPEYIRFLTSKFKVSMFNNFPIISVRSYKMDEMHWRFFKRTFDLIFTVLLFLLLFSWLWPLVALGIKITSKGPVFFRQERWGRTNRKIICYKFRSMVTTSQDVDESGRYQQAKKNDPRITMIGNILRKTNIDEMPQFWNVLKGEMSVVGPRPHPTPLNLESKDTIIHYMRRHLVKPGITGWAQVNGFRGETRDPLQMQKRIEYDLWYIENWSFLLDFQIVFMTVFKTIKGDPMAY